MKYLDDISSLSALARSVQDLGANEICPISHRECTCIECVCVWGGGGGGQMLPPSPHYILYGN